MNANRIWVIGAVVAIVALVAGGWFLGVQPQLDSAAAANLQKASIQQLNTVNEAALRALQAESAKKGALTSQLADLSASVPGLPQLPAFLDEVNQIATSNNVVVSNTTTSSSVSYEGPARTTQTTSGTAASAGSSSTPTSSPGPTASPSATPAPAPTPTGVPIVTNPLITSKNFVAIPVSFTLTGDTTSILNVVDGLQKGKRLFLVNGFTTSVPPAGSTIAGVEATVSGFVYVVQSDRPVQGAG